jgi:hypothetical protein
LRGKSRSPRRLALRSEPARSNTKPCKGLGSSSSTGGGATVTRRPAASVGPCFSSPKARPRRCLKPSESKARCCCEKSMVTTSRTPAPKSIDSAPNHSRARERARHAARQPCRPLPASPLREVQAAAREKRRSDLRHPVRLPHVLQQQEVQVRLGPARLASACFQRATARGGESSEPGAPLRSSRAAWGGRCPHRASLRQLHFPPWAPGSPALLIAR